MQHKLSLSAPITMFCAALILSGCMVGPNYQPPSMAVPKNWRVLEVVELNQAQIQVSDAAAIDHAWWRQFNDPVLEKLINKARIQNLDIKQAITRVAAARALYGGSAAGLVPA